MVSMDMQEFTMKVDEMGLGVVYNTYRQYGINHCFVMVTERGSTGKFLKEECLDIELNSTLQKMLDDIEGIYKKDKI